MKYDRVVNEKKRKLAEELSKPEEEQNKHKIRRLEKSIKRNKNIANKIARCKKNKRRKIERRL